MEFRILGPLEASDGGELLPVRGEKQKALLAILLLHANEVVPTDRLVDELWAGRPPRRGAAALQVLVWKLRKALSGEGASQRIETRPPGYVLRVGADELDMLRFERLLESGRRSLAEGDPTSASRVLGEAVELWRGPTLAEFAYEDFAQAATARLVELRLVAVELRIEAGLVLGRHQELVGELEGLVEQNPLRERLYAHLMLALYRSGRQAEALGAYQRARQALVDELGIEPGRSLHELERLVLQQDQSLELAPEPALARPAGELAAGSILVVAGDESQLSGLLALAEALSRQPAREVIVTRLLEDDSELTEASARLLEHRDRLGERGVVVRAATFTSGDRAEDTLRLAIEQPVDLLLVDAPAGLLESGSAPADLEAVLVRAPCDVAIVVAPEDAAGEIRGESVLVPFGGAEDDWAAAELAAWIAKSHDVPLRLLGVRADPGGGRRDASRLLANASLLIQRLLGVAAEPLLVDRDSDAIAAAASSEGLLVLGLSGQSGVALSSGRLALAHAAASGRILVRKGLRPGGLAPPDALTRFTWSLTHGAPSS